MAIDNEFINCYEYPFFNLDTGEDLSLNAKDASSVQRLNLSLDKESEVSGTVLYKEGDDVYLSGEEFHTFIIGDSGTGKTRRIVYPSIILSSRSKASFVISDSKGEIYRHTANTLNIEGYDIKVLNLRHPLKGNAWNPFSIIEKFWDSGERDTASLMLSDMFSTVMASCHSENDVYWENAAKSVLLGASLFLLEKGVGKNRLSFPALSSIIGEIINTNSQEYYERIFDSTGQWPQGLGDYIDGEIKSCLSPVLGNTEKTVEGIRSVLNTSLSPYIFSSGIRDMLSNSTLKIENIAKKPTALFIVVPDDNDEMYSVVALLIKQIYTELLIQADSSDSGKLKRKVIFFLDEFSNFSKIPTMHSMLTASRSRGIRFMLVCQSSEQLDMKYGELAADVIRSNCRVWVYLGSRSYRLLSLLSELAGYSINPITMEKTPLLSITSLQRLKPGEAIVFNDRDAPIVSRFPDISEYGIKKRVLKATNLNAMEDRQIKSMPFDAKAFLAFFMKNFENLQPCKGSSKLS